MLKDTINGIIQNKKAELEAKYEANKDEIHAEGEKIKAKFKKIGIISGFVAVGLAVLLAIGLFTEPKIETLPSSNQIAIQQKASIVPSEPPKIKQVEKAIEPEAIEEIPEEKIPEPQEEIQEPVEAPPEETKTPVEPPKEETPAVVPAPVEVEEPKEEQEKEYDFVLNTNTYKYHNTYCSDGKKIKSKNRWDYHGTILEVEKMGYVACKKCGGT